MLRVTGSPLPLCDSLSRRAFLQIGGLALGGMSLAEILRAESANGHRQNDRGVIMVFLPGGPPHQDMWDIKSTAPSEIRGEFSAIPTCVPGIEICELFPRLAACADRLTFIRSIVGATGNHYAFQCLTGRSHRQQPTGGWPALGPVLSKLLGPTDPSIPPAVGLSPKMKYREWSDNGSPGFLGLKHSPLTLGADGGQDLVLNGITLDRLRDRRKVLGAFDRFRRAVDAGGSMEGLDAFHERAFGILTSSRLADALDLEREPRALRDRYGYGEDVLQDDGSTRLLTNFLLARRLIEAGVRCVTLSFSRWDWHYDNFPQGRRDFPMLDQAVSALVEDLDQRGMLDRVSVVVWGEFGRTPQINARGGRDHWPQVSCALLAGGGLRHGQVIGATNRLGEFAEKRPVHFQEVFATLYHALGIDAGGVVLQDLQGRPQSLLEPQYQPLPELV